MLIYLFFARASLEKVRIWARAEYLTAETLRIHELKNLSTGRNSPLSRFLAGNFARMPAAALREYAGERRTEASLMMSSRESMLRSCSASSWLMPLLRKIRSVKSGIFGVKMIKL